MEAHIQEDYSIMKFLQEAARGAFGSVSPRGYTALLTTLLALIVPTAAFAGEADVKLNFSAAHGIAVQLLAEHDQ